MRLFGYVISRGVDADQKNDTGVQVVESPTNDGSLEINATHGSFQSYGISLDVAAIDETALITKYRDLSLQPEVEKAIDDIINEAFTYDNINGPVDIDTTSVDVSEDIKNKIKIEFDAILKMLNFKFECYHIFKRWYVDGRLYIHKVIDQNNVRNGITKLVIIDPRKIKKVKEQIRNRNKKYPAEAIITYNSIEINKKYVEYFLYNPNGLNKATPNGVPIAPNSICYIHSGLLDKTNTFVLSHLNPAIKIFNSLRMMEDSLVIYRLCRAPERRVFNIEVGNLPKMKAEQYLAEVMRKHNKKLKFDPQTGEVSDDKRIMTMLEDFWFPKRDGKGTTVDTLQSSGTLLQLDDVEYFKRKLYEALKVPIGRLDANANFNLGRSSEITRDELKFSIFISRLRAQFSQMFLNVLGDQLILKGILNSTEWDVYKDNITITYVENNHFTELKEAEIIQNRVSTLQQVDPYIGKLFSQEWVRTNILRLSEEEWERMQDQINSEPPWQSPNAGGFMPPDGMQPGGMDGGFGAEGQEGMGQNQGPPSDDENDEDKTNQSWISPAQK